MSSAPKQILWIGAREPLIQLAKQSTLNLNVLNLHATTSEEIHSVIEGSVVNLVIIGTSPHTVPTLSESTIMGLSTIPILVSTAWIASDVVRRLSADIFRDSSDLTARITKLLMGESKRMSSDKEALIERLASRAAVRTEEGAWEYGPVERRLERSLAFASELDSADRVNLAIMCGAFDQAISRRRIFRNIISDTEDAFCSELRTLLINHRKYDLAPWMFFSLEASSPQQLRISLQAFAGPLRCERIEAEKHSSESLSSLLGNIAVGANDQLKRLPKMKWPSSRLWQNNSSPEIRRKAAANFVIASGSAILSDIATNHLDLSSRSYSESTAGTSTSTAMGLAMRSLGYTAMLSWLLSVGMCLKEYGQYEIRTVGDLRKGDSRIEFSAHPSWIQLISTNLSFAQSASSGQ
jgi:hypothetical protein